MSLIVYHHSDFWLNVLWCPLRARFLHSVAVLWSVVAKLCGDEPTWCLVGKKCNVIVLWDRCLASWIGWGLLSAKPLLTPQSTSSPTLSGDYHCPKPLVNNYSRPNYVTRVLNYLFTQSIDTLFMLCYIFQFKQSILYSFKSFYQLMFHDVSGCFVRKCCVHWLCFPGCLFSSSLCHIHEVCFDGKL